MLVFGTYAFPIQTLDPMRYGLPTGVQLQLYCKIAHLFWIPVFPTGRMWVVKINGEKYEPSAEIRRAIEANEHKRSVPFYAFALPLLLAIGIPGYSLYEGYQQKQSQARYEKQDLERKQALRGQIAFPEQGDLLFFKSHQPGDPNYRTTSSAAVVEAVTSDSLLLRFPEASESVGSYRPMTVFSDVNKPMSFLWVAKDDLKSTIDLESSSRNSVGNPISGMLSGREINVTEMKKGNPDDWHTMGHPEQPLSRFHPVGQ